VAEAQNSIYIKCQQAWQQQQQQQASVHHCPTPPPEASSSEASSVSADSSNLFNKLQQQLLPPLFAVRASLVMDNTLWMSGPLAVPQRVTTVLWGLTLLVESLLGWATSLTYMSQEHLQSELSGQAAEQEWQAALAQLYETHLKPTQHLQQELLQAAQAVAAATCRLLSQAGPAEGPAAEEVKAQVSDS